MSQPGTTNPVYEKTPPQIRKPLSSSSTPMVPPVPWVAWQNPLVISALVSLSLSPVLHLLGKLSGPGREQETSRNAGCGVIRIALRPVTRILEKKKKKKVYVSECIPTANNYKTHRFQTHGRPSILQVTCYIGVFIYAEMKLLHRKLKEYYH